MQRAVFLLVLTREHWWVSLSRMMCIYNCGINVFVVLSILFCVNGNSVGCKYDFSFCFVLYCVGVVPVTPKDFCVIDIFKRYLFVGNSPVYHK